MNQLYNSRVVKFEWVTRAMNSSGKHISNNTVINHEGILITLESGKQYLVHIVPDMKAVLVDANEMSHHWSVRQSKSVNTTVGKIMAVAEGMG